MKIKMMKNKQPMIYIDNNAMNKMEQYIKQVNNEVGWLGTVVKSGLNFLIKDVYLFKQEVHGATTEITTDGLNDFAMELMSTEDGMEVWNDMKMWGHSHVNMSTSPSSQDDKQMELFESGGNDFFIRLIANKQGSKKFDLYDYVTGIIYEDVAYQLHLQGSELAYVNELEKKIQELRSKIEFAKSMKEEDVQIITDEIKEKVKTKTYANYNVKGNNSYYDNWADTYGYGTQITDNKNKVQEIFDNMKEKEVFEAFLLLQEEDIIDISLENLSLRESIDLEDKIYDYCETYRADYEKWLNKEYGGM